MLRVFLVAIMLALCTPAFAADPCKCAEPHMLVVARADNGGLELLDPNCTCAPCKCCKACCADGVQSLPAVPTPAKPSGGPLDLKITWPDWLQNLSKQALEAAWWDGARTGGFLGYLAGFSSALIIVGIWFRPYPPAK